jgi:hypothetical protein
MACSGITLPLIISQYSNLSVYEQSVYEFSLIRDAQINTCFSIYEPIFAYTSSFLAQTDRLFPSGSNGKLIFVLRVFALLEVSEEQIKLINRGITVPVISSRETGGLSVRQWIFIQRVFLVRSPVRSVCAFLRSRTEAVLFAKDKIVGT